MCQSRAVVETKPFETKTVKFFRDRNRHFSRDQDRDREKNNAILKQQELKYFCD